MQECHCNDRWLNYIDIRQSVFILVIMTMTMTMTIVTNSKSTLNPFVGQCINDSYFQSCM